MALQTLTTTFTAPSGQAATDLPDPDDTNANSNLLGANGPTPLIPAFLLSGLLVVGIVMMCWWKRLARRRVGSGVGAAGAVGVGVDVGVGGGGGRMPGGVRMFVLAGPGMQQQEGRKKNAKVGPRPRLWDAYLKREAPPVEAREARWRDMKPVSASYIPTSSQPSVPSRNDPPRTVAFSPSTATNYASRPPEPLPPPPPSRSPRLRVSVLISMPTPTSPSQRRHLGEERFESSVSSEIEIEKARSPGDAREGPGDLNLALGIAEVPVVLSKG